MAPSYREGRCWLEGRSVQGGGEGTMMGTFFLEERHVPHRLRELNMMTRLHVLVVLVSMFRDMLLIALSPWIAH